MRKLTLLALTALSVASQAVVLTQTGFEQIEGYVPGGIAGQGDWDTFSDPDMSVVDTMAHTGTQSLLINTDSGTWPSGSGWSWPNLAPNYDPSATSNKVLITSAYFFIQSGTNDGGASRAFGFDAYTPDVERVALARIRSDNGTVELLSGLANSTIKTSTMSVSRDAWHQLALILDFRTNVARVLLDGVDAGVSDSIDGTATLNDVDVYATEAVPAGGNSLGVAFVDNYRVEAVPEPATLAALGMGVLALARRRRK